MFMIAMIVLFQKYKVFTQRLILYLSFAALFDAMFYAMGDFETVGAQCQFQAWGQTYFDWSVLLWVSCITFNLYWNAVHLKSSRTFERWYQIVAFGVPLVISMLPFIGNHYGPAGMWCWIVDDWKWRFGIWFIPLYVLISIMITVYIYILYSVNKQMKTWEGIYDPEVQRKKLVLKEDVKPLRIYVFVYLVVSIFPIIDRVHNAVSYDPVFLLVLLHVATQPIQGAANAIIFGLDKDMRSCLNVSTLRDAVLSWYYRSESAIRDYPSSSGEAIALNESDDANGSIEYSSNREEPTVLQ